jgi:hypothetical protein
MQRDGLIEKLHTMTFTAAAADTGCDFPDA